MRDETQRERSDEIKRDRETRYRLMRDIDIWI